MLENVFQLDDLRSLARSRIRKTETKSVDSKSLGESLVDGWCVVKKGKASTRLQREKLLSTYFEDRVWSMLFRMEFLLLSGSQGATLQASGKTTGGQISILGVDSELSLAIECVASETVTRGQVLAQKLELLASHREGLARSLAAQWPTNQKRQTVLALFTCNVDLGDAIRERAKALNVFLFDEADLEYYEKLTSHLGPAAKYQFFADMLPGKTIPGLEIRVPAVKTKMGRYNCYTFPIAPEYLLKISYVSHRTKGKASDINTYQRMIAKSRLNSIRQYISEQGIFPTNIVVNLEKKCVDFQRIKQENSQDESEASGVAGWLKIRPAFKSAWIIDGQHRLFAYSGHPRARNSHLAVLAFEGIPPSTQARLFVDINAKQKSVRPSLLQELFAELHWDAESPSIRMQAIISKAVQVLDKEKDSPLFGRIQTADATKDAKRCISLASVFKSIEKQGFYILKESKDEVLEAGPLWADSNDKTLCRTVFVIKGWLNMIRDGQPEWWDLGSAEGGGFAMNDSLTSCINVLKSVFAHLETSGRKLHRLSDKELVSAITPYGTALASYFARLTLEERKRYRDLRGGQGQTTRTRRCQQAIRELHPTFEPAGLDEFIRSEKEQTNAKAKVIIDRIETLLRQVVVQELKQEHSESHEAWWSQGVPKSVRLEVTKRQENDDNRRGGKEAYFDLIDYRLIAENNWSLFQDLFGQGKRNQSKDKQTKWMVEVNEWRNQVAHASSGVVLSVDVLSQLENYEMWLKRNVSKVEDLSEDEAELEVVTED